MKSIYIILLSISLASVVSCEGFLEENPPTFISTSNFYQDESQARSGLDAAYNSLDNHSSVTSAYGFSWPMLDLGTDDVSSKLNENNESPDFLSHNISSTLRFINLRQQYAIWWQGISRANYAMENIPNVPDMDDATKNSMVGEARALRALYYLHLVKTFGDVPLMLNYVSTEAQINVDRAPVDDVYDEIIIPDLKFAEEHCEDALHFGRVTKWTAKIILADVYLTRAGWRRTSQGEFVQGDPVNWALARDKALEIIENSPHSLNTVPEVDGLHVTPSYGVAWNNPFTSESMMEVATLAEDGLGSRLSKGCAASNSGVSYWGLFSAQPLLDEGNSSTVSQMRFPGRPGTAGNYIPTPNLYRAFEDGDIRGEWSLMTRYKTADGTEYVIAPVFRKYVDIDYYLGLPETSQFRTNSNFILYRYADALLIYAEAANEAEGSPSDLAYDAVNQIRRRAFEVTDDSRDFSGLSQEEFRTAVWLERRREFNGEVKRRFDLIRTNRLFTATDPSVPNQMDRFWSEEEDSATEYTNMHILYGSAPFPDREWLLPIPQVDITLTGWEQNEGY
ncbi:RagB/SusD family nutrient uptake outer membrane protein [Algibacter sp. L3A6]|uniref:RagB/SusD family nutrient uptake outer membrane protein n=1 Tax=Algibacter sp. L3A6 TaxID=2686366 RepID=UPI00131BDD48|nr:RagB/SusD family nutrient uptake outer membrane protein [Algibacter sp. L3A6]